MADSMVLETQKWLNKTYGNVSGFGSVTEDGITGWGTMYGLIRGLQHELGITGLVDNFGPGTASAWDSQFKNKVVVGFSHNVVQIIQGGFWCKGISPFAFDGNFTDLTLNAVLALKQDTGIRDTSGTVDSTFMAALLTMNAFVLVPEGDAKIRSMQQSLNHDYQPYTGILPTDGIYQRATNTALIYALQAEEGMAVGTANGVYGPGTTNLTPTLKQGDTGNFVKILQWALYVNGFYQDGDFDGIYGTGVAQAVSSFRSFMGLADGTTANLDVIKGLLSSSGNTDRAAVGCDTSFQLNSSRINVLTSAGYKYVGRYLTGTVGFESNGTLRDKFLTREEMDDIVVAGMKIFPIYQDGASNSDNYFTSAQGTTDAIKAITAAHNLGFKRGTTIYFAVDTDIQDGDIAGTVLLYFSSIYTILSGAGYGIGVYGTRNVASRVISAGYAKVAFVSDMSTGFSGNLGFSMPKQWAFDQFSETSIGDFAIDKLGVNFENETAVNSFNDIDFDYVTDGKASNILNSTPWTKPFVALNWKIGQTAHMTSGVVDTYVSLENKLSASDTAYTIELPVIGGVFSSSVAADIEAFEELHGIIQSSDTIAILDKLANAVQSGSVYIGFATRLENTVGLKFVIETSFKEIDNDGNEVSNSLALIFEIYIHPSLSTVSSADFNKAQNVVKSVEAGTVLIEESTMYVINSSFQMLKNALDSVSLSADELEATVLDEVGIGMVILIIILLPIGV